MENSSKMDSSRLTFEQASTPAKPTESDENDCCCPQGWPNSSEVKKKRASKEKILAEINNVSSANALEPSPCKLNKTLSSGSEMKEPSLSPYAPVKNYLSPRPQYLRYKPNRRQEKFLRLEKDIKLKENAYSDDGQKADCRDFNSSNSPASSVASVIPEYIKKQEKEERNNDDDEEQIEEDGEEEEEEEEEEGSSFMEGLLKFLFLIVVLILSTSYICNMNTFSLSKGLVEGIEIEKVYWSNQNSTICTGTLQILDGERSYEGHSDWFKFHISFLFEDVSRSVDMDAYDGNLGVNEAKHNGAEEDVSTIESGVIPGLQMRETEVGAGALLIENSEEGEVSVEETEAGVLELQVTEPERSFRAVNTWDSEEIKLSSAEIEAEVVEEQSRMKRKQTVDVIAELSSVKEILVGLIESNWILRALVGLSISSLILTLLFIRKKNAWNQSSQGKELHSEPVIGTRTKCDDLQVIHNKEEDMSLNMCACPSPVVKHLIIDDEDRMSIRRRAPSVELLGEFVVEVSSSVKQSDVKKETMEFGDRTQSIPMEKKYKYTESSSMSSRRFTTTTRNITSKEEKDGAGHGKREALIRDSSTPVRRSSRIRNRTMQSP